jgi:hypothetical protein
MAWDQTNAIWLQELPSQEFIAGCGYGYVFQEHFNNSNLEELSPIALVRLTQHGEVSLIIFFQYAPAIKDLRPLRLVPFKKLRPF